MVVGFALTRSVRDCAAALDAVEGPAIGDPFEIPRPVTPYLTETAQAPGRLRIAVTTRAWSGLPIDPEVAAAVAVTAMLLQQLGHTVIEDAPLFDYDTFLAAQIDLWVGHTAAFMDAIAQAVGRVPSEQNLQSTSFATYVAGKKLPATRLVAAEEHYNLVTRQVAQFLAGYDLLLTPTNTCLPLPLDAHQLDAPGATVQDLFDHLAPIETFTALFNGTRPPRDLVPAPGQPRRPPHRHAVRCRFRSGGHAVPPRRSAREYATLASTAADALCIEMITQSGSAQGRQCAPIRRDVTLSPSSAYTKAACGTSRA
jgi:amidase